MIKRKLMILKIKNQRYNSVECKDRCLIQLLLPLDKKYCECQIGLKLVTFTGQML